MDGESCIRKAYEYILNSDFEAAIYWFEQAIAAEPDNAGYYHKCAVSCARSGKWPKAKIYADIAERLEPDNEEFRYHSQLVRSQVLLAEANVLLARTPPLLMDAEDLLRQAAALDPIGFDARYKLAIVCQTRGYLDEALMHTREALRLDPQHAAAKRLFADISRKRRIERIRSSFRRGKG